MKFSLWTNHGALNSRPIFDAFATSLRNGGYDVAYNDIHGDVHVIWSVLWHGRMARNKDVWDRAKQENKKIIVLEVGGIKRGTTWKVGLNGINRDAYFGPGGNDSSRAEQLGLVLKPWRTEGEYILICGQHEKSQQWQSMPNMTAWLGNTINSIREYTDMPIYWRPHPRYPVQYAEQDFKNVVRQTPSKLENTYDDYDFNVRSAWATVAFSSNPGPHSIIAGIPAFVGTSSLAYDVGNDSLKDIMNPRMPDRQQWLNDYAHTEHTVEEISAGLPLKRLTSEL
tara:strand:- start:1532 stop:2377 length:846 start_codon:yes stop_codon:yes gene_type:complete